MSKIKVLSETLAHQIAAGEIVDRPASVVKELMENSLDAGARRIQVEAEDGGRRLILVRDDGIGMSREDAPLAFHRHATSKIGGLEDLARIFTLGFRGEALPSIASVSRLRLRTVERERADETAFGTEVEYLGGELQGVKEIAWPQGTEVRVEDLFFNVPARRKFMRRPSTEMGHLSRQVQCYALAYPEVEFRLRHNGRELFDAPSSESQADRVLQLLGEKFLDNMSEIDYERFGVRVTGFTSLPHEQRSNASGQYLFVNRRMVRDRVLTHAVRQAYRDLIPSAAHPVVILLVELDPELIDVNVHPAKTEIRFRQSSDVHRAVHHAIEEALLRRGEGLGSLARDLPSDRLQGPEESPADPLRRGVARSVESFFRRQTADSPLFSSASGQPRKSGSDTGPGADDFSLPSSDPHAVEIPETTHISAAPVVLGQFVESFIVAADRDGVMLIDQHVAHERILYEKALAQMTGPRGVAVQRLLIPRTLELTTQEKTVLEGILEELRANGFEVEWFGERTIVIKGLPLLVKDCQADRLLQEILHDLGSGRREADSSGGALQRLRERIAVSMSCRAAIKINTVLSLEKMQWFLDELFRCPNPYTCPHGRPIVLRLGVEDVLKAFHRI